MKKKNKINKLVILFIISLFNFLPFKAFSKNFLISEESFLRLEQYFDKKIFSYVYDNEIANISNLAVAISQDGKNTVLAYCREDDKFLCALSSPYLFQTKKRCERKFGKKCEIIFKENYLINNDKKIFIKDKSFLKNYFNTFISDHDAKIYHSDFEVASSRDTENCGSDDC